MRTWSCSGHRVIVLDRARGADQGSTSASSAIVRFNFTTTAGVAMAWEEWDSATLAERDPGIDAGRYWPFLVLAHVQPDHVVLAVE